MELNSLRSSPTSAQRDNALEWSASSSSSGTIGGPINASNSGTVAGAAAPAPASGFFATPFAAVGVEYGKNLLKSKTAEQLSAGLGGWLRQSRVRAYFQVSQLVVMRKVRKMLFPYVHRDWARQRLGESDGGLLAAGVEEGINPTVDYASAKEDVNAPDLYVGLMAFCTFVVTMGFAQGSIGHFSPETLGLTATRSLVCVMFEIACVYGAFYLADAPHSAPLLDLICLVLGQFVALNIDVLVGVVAGPALFYITFIALAVSTAVYMMRSLQGWQPASSDALAHSPISPRYRSMLGVTALLQLAFSFFLLWPALTAVHSSRGLSVSGLSGLERAETSAGGMLAPSDNDVTPAISRHESTPTHAATPATQPRRTAPTQPRLDDIPSVMPTDDAVSEPAAAQAEPARPAASRPTTAPAAAADADTQISSADEGADVPRAASPAPTSPAAPTRAPAVGNPRTRPSSSKLPRQPRATRL